MRKAYVPYLDWLILDSLIAGDASGRQIQEKLKRRRVHEPWETLNAKLSLLEDDNLVDGRFVERCIGDDCNMNRIYSISPDGIQEYVASELRFQRMTGNN